jgi:hypothetical protein
MVPTPRTHFRGWRQYRRNMGMVAKTKRFEALQGFNDRYRVCEDLELIKRLYRQGAFTVLPQKIKTSSRRFHENGVARLLIHFGVLHLMHWWGVGPQSLSLYYRWAVR